MSKNAPELTARPVNSGSGNRPLEDISKKIDTEMTDRILTTIPILMRQLTMNQLIILKNCD